MILAGKVAAGKGWLLAKRPPRRLVFLERNMPETIGRRAQISMRAGKVRQLWREQGQKVFVERGGRKREKGET